MEQQCPGEDKDADPSSDEFDKFSAFISKNFEHLKLEKLYALRDELSDRIIVRLEIIPKEF